MGHQVPFHLTFGDMASLETQISKAGPFLLLHYRSQSEKPRVLESSDLVENGQRWSSFNLVRPEDLGAVVTEFVPAQNYWTVQTLPSPVIEFFGGGPTGNKLNSGRLYYTDDYYDADGMRIWKSEEFRRWAKKVLSIARRNLKRLDGFYIGKEASEWLAIPGNKLGL